MKHPIFHVDETCLACVPWSGGVELKECTVTGPLVRRSIRDLDGQHLGFALAYKVRLRGATLECLFAERDLRKQWQRSDWPSLRCDWYGESRQIWRPKREAR